MEKLLCVCEWCCMKAEPAESRTLIKMAMWEFWCRLEPAASHTFGSLAAKDVCMLQISINGSWSITRYQHLSLLSVFLVSKL